MEPDTENLDDWNKQVGFTGPLVIKEIGYELWEHTEPFSFISSTGIIVRIEKGDITDLASIYGVPAGLVPKIGYWSQPATVHDKIYKAHRDGIPFRSFTNKENITRKEADLILLEGAKIKAKEYQVPFRKRRHNSIYAAVNAFGIESWETVDEKLERLKQFDNSSIIDN